jgi:hypothetical protein
MTRKKKNVVSSDWWSLADIYHHVLKQSSSPEAAKIVISEARKNGRLPLKCERHEHKAGREGEVKIVSDYQIVDKQIPRWDWERSYASRTDPKTKSLFEYQNIRGSGDVALVIWPPKEDEPPSPSRRRPGPITTHDWYAICGEIARCCVDPKTRCLKVPENERQLARDILEWCQLHNKEEPSESAMREAVKAICAALRRV